MKNQKAFTLVELIVVITILAILGTIAFLSLQGYSASARNSKRISDIANIKTSLALFNTKTGRYPDPDNITDVIYKGAMVWSQGEVGEGVTRNLSKNLPKTPLDPLLEQPYVYSLLNTKKEYEVGCIFETDPNNLTIGIGNQTNAANKRYYAYIKGDYNGKVAKVSTGSQLYVFAVPSIIGSNLSDPDIEEIIRKKELVYNGYQNIPANYFGRDITMTGSFEFGGDSINIVVYSGSIEDLSQSYEALQTFGTNLQNAYSGSILANDSSYKDITLMNLDDSDSIRQIAGSIVKENLGGEIAPAVECADKPNYTHTNFISGNVLVDGTSRQNSNASIPCYYECTGGYSGNDCSIGPSCATNPGYPNANFIEGTPMSYNIPWQNTNPTNPCYYSCTGGYTGTQCNIGTCEAQNHGTTNTSYTTGTPTTIGQSWQNTSSSSPCYYTCTGGYSGTNCDVGTCAAQNHGTTHTSYTTGNPTTIGVIWQNTNSGNACYYTCTDGYGGTNCDLTGWRLADPNCPIEDIVIGTQTWAGCNSTIGTGYEYTTNTYCYNYNGVNLGVSGNCGVGNYGDSTDTELAYFESIYGVGGSTPNGDKGINTIWGKGYPRANTSTACSTGRHVPTDAEWLVLYNYIVANNGGNTNIGWKGHTAKSNTNNVVNALKLPLAGNTGSTAYRGYYTFRWTSSQYNSTTGRDRSVNTDSGYFGRAGDNKVAQFLVRCIKN